MKTLLKPQTPLLKYFASLKLTVVCLVLLAVQTVIGTLYQVDLGIYQASHKVFYTWFFWIAGFVPFPGVRLVLWVMFLNLVSALFVRLPLRAKYLGLWLAHLGLLLLFVGAFLKFHYAEDSQLTLVEGDYSNLSASYHHWELAFWKESEDQKSPRKVLAIDMLALDELQKNQIGDWGVELELLEMAEHARVLPGEKIQSLKLLSEPEKNFPACRIRLSDDQRSQEVFLAGYNELPERLELGSEPFMVSLRRIRTVLPATIELIDLKRELHPGTDKARHYESRVFVRQGEIEREVLISMNKPLRIGNWTFYQATYALDGNGREYSTLAVVKNVGRLLPYISSLAMFAGLMVHFLVMFAGYWRKSIKLVLAAAFLGSCLSPAFAVEDTSQFERLLILDSGRVKPMQTYAQSLLVQFSGKRSIEGQTASQWLADLLFVPERTKAQKLFLVNHPEVLSALGIEEQKGRRYSFEQFEDHLQKLDELANLAFRIEQGERSLVERELVFLASKVRMYLILSNCFAQGFESPIKVFPALDNSERWFSAQQVVMEGLAREHYEQAMQLLFEAVKAYQQEDALKFNLFLRQFSLWVSSQLGQQSTLRQASLELVYNRLDPIFWAKVSYILVWFLALLSLIWAWRWLNQLSFVVLLGGFLVHSLGIVMRILIMNRAPVSTLYETFVFVAWVCVLVGLVLELLKKRSLGLIAGSFSGLSLLFIASRYSLEGDTLKMLEAVLNSNFWLSTHVLAITTGYAGCCMAGVMAHIYLIQACRGSKALKESFRMVYALLAFGLVMSFLGTVLGGIWADQSWGRFWGWDPKENGALLIVLWCAILFHARMAGMIRDLGFAAGAALGIIVVMVAWFGVNLLGVGLHSYGFTSGVALNLLIYSVLQSAFVAFIVIMIKKREKRL